MADEDALFAEFMGEIKSTVVAAETKGAGDAGEDDDDAASDAASVGDVKADDAEGGGEGRNHADTTKRRGETEASPSPAPKKPRFMGKLVAAARPVKAGAVAAASTARATGSGQKASTGDKGTAAAKKDPDGSGADAGTGGGANGGSKTTKGKKTTTPPPLDSSGKGGKGETTKTGGGGKGKEGVKDGSGSARGGAGGASEGTPAHGGDANGAGSKDDEEMVGFGGSGGVAKQQAGMDMHNNPSQMGGGGPGPMPGNNNGMHMGAPPPGMRGNMGMMGAGNGMAGFGGGGGYGMPPPGMGMNMGMPPGMNMGMPPGMNMGMPPGMGGPGPYPDGSMGYGYGGPMNGMMPGGPGLGMGGSAAGSGAEGGAAAAAAAAAAGGKDKVAKAKAESSNKFKRVAGGKSWEDETLAEWPENDYRLFVGDLGNEVTDDNLAGAFRKYTSFAKAKVVREKWNKKSKGYGFVSFLDGMDMLKALREQQGKYLGNRPMKISKSTWKERDVKELPVWSSLAARRKLAPVPSGLNAEFIKRNKEVKYKVPPALTSITNRPWVKKKTKRAKKVKKALGHL